MLINFVDATNDANHYTKPPPQKLDNMTTRTGLRSFFHEMTGVGLPVTRHSKDTRRPTATERLRGTDMNVGGAVTPNSNATAV